jgi:flagellar basal body-associated protein FliL
MPDQPATPAKEKELEAPSRISGLSSMIKIGGILAAVVAAQCVLAWLLLPSAGSAQSADSKRDHGSTNHDLAAVQQEDPNAERREVDLGKFSVTSIDPATNTTLLIDFHLYGGVLVEPGDEVAEGSTSEHGEGNKKTEGEPDDNTRFGRLLKKTKHRFRDQVIVIIRNAQMSDLSDPALGLIKRQILAKTNTLFGEPLLKEVIFSDFAVVQQ